MLGDQSSKPFYDDDDDDDDDDDESVLFSSVQFFTIINVLVQQA